MIAHWPAPTGYNEFATALQRGRKHCIMVLPALFDEANKLRHFTVEVMRLLDAGGIDCALPDLPGCNESTAPLDQQTIPAWQDAARTAAAHFKATHVLAIRGGALIAPVGVPGWCYAVTTGESILRSLLRARVLASKEAGRSETREGLLATGRQAGLELAGYAIGPGMIRTLETAQPIDLTTISQNQLGGPGLWLRAEPDHSPEQARALADIILTDVAA